MFRTLADARRTLGEHLDGALLDAAVAGLVPTLVFRPNVAGADRIGQTRFGGVPDLSPGASWPRPPAPVDLEAIATRGSDEAAKHMRRHFALGMPYAFIAQIDLAEASALGSPASALPAEGRLLFFYDIVVGCYETGTRPCCVMWDRTERTLLEPCPMPQDLAAAANEYREEMHAIYMQYDMDVAAVNEETNYDTRARPLELAAEFTFPNERVDEGQSFWQAYAALPYPWDDAVWSRSKLLGSPDPVQDDPRRDAVVVSEYGVQVQDLPHAQWGEAGPNIRRGVRDWRLLLQLTLSDWMQADMVEGCVYFLIRHEDLMLRRFDRVVSVYQQT